MDLNGQISIAKNKLQDRIDEQAKLFPALEAEIAERRKKLDAPTGDQKSEQYIQTRLRQDVSRVGIMPKGVPEGIYRVNLTTFQRSVSG